MNDEKILKKVGKLLSMYGVDDEEKEKFLLDLKDKKYDDQEDIEEVVEEKEEEPTEVEGNPAEKGEEEVKQEEVVKEDEKPADDVAPEQEVEEPAPEQDQPQEVVEPVQEQPQETNEELLKTIEGLQSRIQSLEDLVSKLGTPVDENVGVSPTNPSGESAVESEFDRINRLRRGR